LKLISTFSGFLWIAAMIFASPTEAVEMALKAASFQPESVSFAKYFYRWVAETNRRCEGQVEISVVGPDQIPSELQWHALKQGRIDIYYGPANYYRGVMNHVDVFNLARNELDEQRLNGGWALLNDLHNEYMNAWYLTSLAAGVRFFIYTTRPIRDGRFDGFRIRAVPLYEGFIRSLGAEPKFMPATDVLSALKEGRIDGYGWPLWSGGMGWEKFTKYRYGPGFLNTEAPILVNLEKWNSLAEPQRQCLTNMATWLEAEWPDWREKEDVTQLVSLKRAGIVYVDLGIEFAHKPEEIYWSMLSVAEPSFVHQARHLFSPE
jgi:TRAP-type transport system periplasmic protein